MNYQDAVLWVKLNPNNKAWEATSWESDSFLHFSVGSGKLLVWSIEAGKSEVFTPDDVELNSKSWELF